MPYRMQWSSATPGLLIILIDQSGSMLRQYDGRESKTVVASRAVNKVIDTIIDKNYHGDRPKNRCFITVIGYDHDVKELVSGKLEDLNANPLKVDTIKKKEPDNAGGIIEVDYRMPIWIEPIIQGGETNMKGAFEMAKAIIERWTHDKPNNPAPVIINISDGVPYYDGKDRSDCMRETVETAKDIMNMSVADGNVLIFNALIKEAGRNQMFPTTKEECINDESKFLYDISSLIPDAYRDVAHQIELPVRDGSKGCIFESNEVNLINLINFGTTRAQSDI